VKNFGGAGDKALFKLTIEPIWDLFANPVG
jgi:hypothetical protein